jgi:tRNA pseudouridine synthase 9
MRLYTDLRHEPPVFGELVLVGESDDIVAISKPPSLPMHPCGAYRHNSLEYILKREHLVANQPILSIVHRLDRYDAD